MFLFLLLLQLMMSIQATGNPMPRCFLAGITCPNDCAAVSTPLIHTPASLFFPSFSRLSLLSGYDSLVVGRNQIVGSSTRRLCTALATSLRTMPPPSEGWLARSLSLSLSCRMSAAASVCLPFTASPRLLCLPLGFCSFVDGGILILVLMQEARVVRFTAYCLLPFPLSMPWSKVRSSVRNPCFVSKPRTVVQQVAYSA